MTQIDDLKAEMIETNERFRSLHEEHQACEARLSELNHSSLLSPEDEVEEKRLKVRKLSLKDEMEAILREQRAASPA